jgi:hypothetical protein
MDKRARYGPKRRARTRLVVATIVGAALQAGVAYAYFSPKPHPLAIITYACTGIVLVASWKGLAMWLDEKTPAWIQVVLGLAAGFTGPAILQQLVKMA